jgi:hypothetical protein
MKNFLITITKQIIKNTFFLNKVKKQLINFYLQLTNNIIIKGKQFFNQLYDQRFPMQIITNKISVYNCIILDTELLDLENYTALNNDIKDIYSKCQDSAYSLKVSIRSQGDPMIKKLDTSNTVEIASKNFFLKKYITVNEIKVGIHKLIKEELQKYGFQNMRVICLTLIKYDNKPK